ncbi:hypothetical protein EW146_g1999 [Bondarzewia mesenterica]|uniref:DUF155 domain-containing protein n=1 Tax=Bondarzewia mesenterica TaxID=1095465 RepID=A0A4S4M2N3_9AGAM|nr:hypothetical protein EW146_g1999 [Bondarzewia mesenterica]
MSLPPRPPRPTRAPSDRPALIRRRPSLTIPSTPSIPNPQSRKGPVSANPQRTSKTSQKLVLLPSGPQTKPLLTTLDEDEAHGYETDAGVRVREHKSEGERMSKAERRRAGYKRITVCCVAEGFKMKLLASFLKREHNVVPRVFDEALYVMYHLPLLPGYDPTVNIRASAPSQDRHLSRMSEAEENGYQGTYFGSVPSDTAFSLRDGYISSSSPVENRRPSSSHRETETEVETEVDESMERQDVDEGHATREDKSSKARERFDGENVAEVVFFAYGVIVFFGLDEGQERSILEDIEGAGTLKRKLPEDDWEVEECHYAYDPTITYPRIYNDFFTFKTPSHLLTLSVAHALAQSTLLARYESLADTILSDPRTTTIPRQLASTGVLNLTRTQAMKLTGRLFRLRRDVVLGGNVLDVPELFWSEASLRGLYDAVRGYLEIGDRVRNLNEKLVGANDLLDAIHDHLNNNAMERITWIIIWLIVVAILVDLGEVVARLIVHASMGSSSASLVPSTRMLSLSPEDALRSVERMMTVGK